MKFLNQAILILITFFLIFLWQVSPLAEYTIPALGFLIFLSLLLTSKKGPIKLARVEGLNVLILTAIVLLLIFSTNGLDSPLYFLLYFIAFAVGFILLPETVFIYALGAVLIFLPDSLAQNVSENLIKLGSLVLISPLAFFFGKEYKARQEHDKEDKEAAETITKDALEILQKEENNLPDEDKAKLTEIVQTSESLKTEEKQP